MRDMSYQERYLPRMQECRNIGLCPPKERAVQIYYLENGMYALKHSYILQDDKEEAHYNADTIITLKEFPNISMTLMDVFENVEE